MKKKLSILAVALLALGLSACGASHNGPPSATKANQQLEANQEKIYNLSQPIPVFPFSQYRQTAIDIETFEAEGGPTTSFMMPNNWAPGVRPLYQCPSVGMPVAATTQLSNPQQVVNSYSGQSGVASATISQIDPNGVFAGNSTGTYSLCLNAKGQKYAAYWEGYVLALAGNAAFDPSTGTISDVTNPTGTFNTLTPAQQEAVNQAAIAAYQHTATHTP
jgi:hypothetical protein